ncbi:MAG: DNA-binding NtrC family response regulator [Myxococcota bacterium]|jgi:DNA-binding NtrC family response regulator
MDNPEILGLRVIVADPNSAGRKAIASSLRAAGCEVVVTGKMREVMASIRARAIDVVLYDVELPLAGGKDLLSWIVGEAHDVDAIPLASRVFLPDAVAALKQGATDYLTKPLDHELLLHTMGRISARRRLERQVQTARRDLVSKVFGPAIIGQSVPMERLFERLDRMAKSQATVLVRGESGTGKELVARLIHQRSTRADRPFVAVNCAAFPETLLEAELFGHERGAFTGAQRKRVGRFEAADQGTLFLDEVAEIPLAGQAKLLRVLQEGVIEPLGSNKSLRVDVRIVSATHRDLRQRIAAGLFREDLYFRLKVLEARIPPLRERDGDIPLLVEHFLQRFSMSEPIPSLTHQAWNALLRHPFPGNVRELEHAIQHGVVLADDVIDLAHLPTEIGGEDVPEQGEDTAFLPLNDAVREFERNYLIQALNLTDGGRSRTAALLGISRKNLWEKLRAHGLAEVLKKKSVAKA